MQPKLPKIGIRPIVDGRYGGVRESLEPVALQMANAAAALIGGELRHPTGEPIEFVIPTSAIGGFAEAAAVEAEFQAQGVGVSLSVTPGWAFGAETMDADAYRPKAIWGFNGSNRPGAVYLAATLAAHAQMGLPCFGIYGSEVQDLGDPTIPPDVAEKLIRFARAGLAVATMRGRAYLAMGGVSMGIAGSIVDHQFFASFLGMRVETIDMSEFTGRIAREMFDKEEFAKALAWVQAHCPEGADLNETPRSRGQKDEDWRTSIKMTLIAKDLMHGNPKLADLGFKEQGRGHHALFGGFQGQRQWNDYFPNGDFMEAILNSSFDWNGTRPPVVMATENDSLNAVSMLFGNLLTGTAQLFADVRTYWSTDSVRRVTGLLLPNGLSGLIHLINSGPAALDWTGQQRLGGAPTIKPFWDVSNKDIEACLANTKWCASDQGYFPGGGWSTDFQTAGPMPATMLRVNLVRGLGPVLQIAEGEVVDLPREIHDVLDARTNPTWPSTWFAPRVTGRSGFESIYSVMSHWGANHAAVCYGHVGADLITLASMLRIPVEMHTVEGEERFRPAVWDRFGAGANHGGDFRACAALGPLYG